MMETDKRFLQYTEISSSPCRLINDDNSTLVDKEVVFLPKVYTAGKSHAQLVCRPQEHPGLYAKVATIRTDYLASVLDSNIFVKSKFGENVLLYKEYELLPSNLQNILIRILPEEHQELIGRVQRILQYLYNEGANYRNIRLMCSKFEDVRDALLLEAYNEYQLKKFNIQIKEKWIEMLLAHKERAIEDVVVDIFMELVLSSTPLSNEIKRLRVLIESSL